MLKTIFWIVVIAFFVWVFFIRPATDDVFDCKIDTSWTDAQGYTHYGILSEFNDVTQEECKFHNERLQKETLEMKKESFLKKEKGQKLECSGWSTSTCTKDGHIYLWESSKLNWIETAISKQCSPYFDAVISQLPVKCLQYFNLEPKS